MTVQGKPITIVNSVFNESKIAQTWEEEAELIGILAGYNWRTDSRGRKDKESGLESRKQARRVA